MTRRLLLLSNSTNEHGDFLLHAREAIAERLAGVSTATFVPFAGVTLSPAAYAERIRAFCAPLGISVQVLPGSAEGRDVLATSEAIIVGGGNTFRLLAQCQQFGLLAAMRRRVQEGVPYVGWSAGSVLACPTIGTTNDMPIVAPTGFRALELVGFQINPHFTDAHPPGFRGETRRQRLAEYVALNPDVPVVGLPEGNWLRVENEQIELGGSHETPWFRNRDAGQFLRDETLQSTLEPTGPPV